MGKAVLKYGIFTVFDGVNYHSYGVTAMDITKTAGEVDLTDTWSAGNDKEYESGRTEKNFTVTIWKDVTKPDLVDGVLYEEGLLDFEGYVYYGSFVLNEASPSASIDEGVQQVYAGRFSGTVLEANGNIYQGAGGYNTGNWDNIGSDFAVGAGATLVQSQVNGDIVGELERTALTNAHFDANVVIPGASYGTLLTIDVFTADEQINVDTIPSRVPGNAPLTTNRQVIFFPILYNVADTGIRIGLEDVGAVVTNKMIINRINLFVIP